MFYCLIFLSTFSIFLQRYLIFKISRLYEMLQVVLTRIFKLFNFT